MATVDFTHDQVGISFQHILYPFFVHFVLFVQIAIKVIVKRWTINSDEGLASKIYEQLRAFAICLDLLNGKDSPQSYLVYDPDEIANIGLFGHLQKNFFCKFLCMYEDI